MENINSWQDFWQEWRNKEAESEDDLFFQVGLTINKKPIDKQAFDLINRSIIDDLRLRSGDILVEFCCGNGLTTFELKDKVKQIIATDFSAHLIRAAQKFKSAPNITYNLGSVFEFLADFKNKWTIHPNKYLMNNSLGYFSPEELRQILSGICDISDGPFLFLLRGIPNDLQKWNYYNTEERRKKYEEWTAAGNFTNDGMGRWWSPEEIGEICSSFGLQYDLCNKEILMSDYRMDVIISR